MSTYLSLACLAHDPPIKSTAEVTQHAGFADEMQAVRTWVADAPHWDRENPNDEAAFDLATQAAPVRLPLRVRRYYARAAVTFLRQHPHCPIGAVTEYGDWVDVGHGLPRSRLSVDIATGQPCVRYKEACSMRILPDHRHRPMTVDDIIGYIVETRDDILADADEAHGDRHDGLGAAAEKMTRLLDRLGWSADPTPTERAEDQIQAVLREHGRHLPYEVVESLAVAVTRSPDDDEKA